jgi:hypothetical protein
MKESMVIYRSFYEALKDLPETKRLQVWDAICELGLNGIEIQLSGLSKTIFTLIKPQIDANNRRAAAGKANGHLGAEYGKLGGRPLKEKPTTNPLDNPQETPSKPSNDNDNVNANGNENVIPDSKESNPDQLQNIITLETTPSLIKKVAVKKESNNHSFANSKYANNHELFISDWNNSNGAVTFPNADPIRIFETLKTASDANAKYKYSNWLSAAINWVRRNPEEYKRLHITQSGQQLHPVEQRMAETLERLNRNSSNGNPDGFGYFTPSS